MKYRNQITVDPGSEEIGKINTRRQQRLRIRVSLIKVFVLVAKERKEVTKVHLQ